MLSQCVSHSIIQVVVICMKGKHLKKSYYKSIIILLSCKTFIWFIYFNPLLLWFQWNVLVQSCCGHSACSFFESSCSLFNKKMFYKTLPTLLISSQFCHFVIPIYKSSERALRISPRDFRRLEEKIPVKCLGRGWQSHRDYFLPSNDSYSWWL